MLYHREINGLTCCTPKLPACFLVNMLLGVNRGIWEYAPYVNNTTNEIAYLAFDRERGTLARVGYLMNPPRSFGIRASFNQ